MWREGEKERRKGIPEGCIALKVEVTENDLLVGVVVINVKDGNHKDDKQQGSWGDRHERKDELEELGYDYVVLSAEFFGLKHGSFNQMNWNYWIFRLGTNKTQLDY